MEAEELPELMETRVNDPLSIPITQQLVYEQQTSGEELLKTPEGKIMAKHYVQQTFSGNLAKEYFTKLIGGTKEIDRNYGVHVEGDVWKIGDKQLEISENDLIIDGKLYPGTRGLYELIFMNNPNEYIYDETDLNNYASIILNTNVHRQNYSILGKIRANRGHKYKNIISKIIVQQKHPMMETNVDQATSSGSGINLLNSPSNVIYFDDPNELVDRLRTLLASEQAGNTGHTNEINAILEELIELRPELS